MKPFRNALAAAMALACVVSVGSAVADNMQVKDALGSTLSVCTKTQTSVEHPCHVMEGQKPDTTYAPFQLDSTGKVIVSGGPTAANQATQIATQGTISDAPWSGTGDGTQIAIAKYIGAKLEATRALLAGTLTVGTHAVTQSGAWSVTVLGSTNYIGKVSQVDSGGTDATDTVNHAMRYSLVAAADGVDATRGAKADAAWDLASSNPTQMAVDKAVATKIEAARALLAGTLTVNTHAVTQSGAWNVTNITGTVSLPTGAATDATLAETHGTKAAGTAATKSELAGLVFNTSLPTLTNGQQAAAQADSSGRLIVNCGAGCAGGTQFAEDSVHVSGDVGTLALVVRRDTASTMVSADGDYSNLIVDASGRLHVNVGTSVLPTGAATEASLARPQGVIGAAAAPTYMNVGGAVYLSSPLTLTNGQSAALRLDSHGALVTTCATSAGAICGDTSDVNIAQVGGATIAQGHGTAATAIRVELPTDGTGVVVNGAGEAHMGEVGGNAISVQVAQTVTASSAYASGNAIGGLMTVANAARVSGSAGTPGTSGILQSVIINSKSAQTTQVDIFLFSANPSGSTCTDKTAFSLAAADFDKVLGVVSVPATTGWYAAGTPSVGQAQNLALPYALASATSVYACAVTRATPTFASTTDISIGYRFLRN